MAKVLVTINRTEDVQTATDAGCEVLAEYADSILVRCDQGQKEAIIQRGLEVTEIDEPDIELTGHRFNVARAMAADAESPISINPDRQSYYLVKLVGPIKQEWLEEIRSQGGTVQASLPSFTLLVGIMPDGISYLEQQSWVEMVSPYRPSMKISPKLEQGPRSSPNAAELAADVAVGDAEAENIQVEINVFEGEDIDALEHTVNSSGGTVLKKGPLSLAAVIPSLSLSELARRQEVQSIVPHEFPKLHNDRARQIMGMSDDNTFGETVLTGRGQIVAICDSGLDTGDADNMHEDFRGRIEGIASLLAPATLAPFTNDPPDHDDGPADTISAHGTHVAGSVLGSGAAGQQNGGDLVPQGLAPEARVFFQAIEKTVNWKSAGQLIAEGIGAPSDWPPPRDGLYGIPDDLRDLFAQAYDAGARIHTNSWGANVAGVYNANSREVDEFVWTHPDMLILFSAGNAGRDVDANGAIDADSIGSPATAKNCLTVGASENNRPADSIPTPGFNARWNQMLNGNGTLRYPALAPAGHVSDAPEGMAAFSSRGPSDDGRLKPDVVAPGTNILSTRSSAYAGDTPPLWGDLPEDHALNGLYCWSGGTSMSTPLVAGAVTLLRQWLIEHDFLEDGVSPSAALIKAIMINGAAQMRGQFSGELPLGPNFASGFGRVDLRGLIGALDSGRVLIFDDPGLTVSSGQMRRFKVRAIDPARPIKVTLVWTDAPSLPNIGRLQNKLYLQVQRPNGAILDGDVRPFPNPVNNVQQVTAPPSSGTHEIRVRGVDVIQQSPRATPGDGMTQDFALVVSNAVESST